VEGICLYVDWGILRTFVLRNWQKSWNLNSKSGVSTVHRNSSILNTHTSQRVTVLTNLLDLILVLNPFWHSGQSVGFIVVRGSQVNNYNSVTWCVWIEANTPIRDSLCWITFQLPRTLLLYLNVYGCLFSSSFCIISSCSSQYPLETS
jgi:hypothetical protein